MPELVYLLCLVTSSAAAFLLLRGYRRTRLQLLLWTGLGFAGLCINNIMLILDMIVFPNVELSAYRAASATVGLSLLVFGLLWNSSNDRGPNP